MRAQPLPQTYAIRGDLAIGGALVPGAVAIADGRISDVLREPREGALPAHVIDVPIVAPGLIDLQVNGGFGVEVGADPDALRTLAARLPESGVTAYLPTLISSPPAAYEGAQAEFLGAGDAPGARALGFHLEGPLLAPTRKGAHPVSPIAQADAAAFDALVAGDWVRLVTLAPERPGALALIRRLRQRGILVSLGHTDATFETFVAGVDAGAEMATHLYNAMSPFGHRAPGAIGAALTDDRVTVGLIADGVHSHPASLRLALRAKGIDRIALVTDMMGAAGMPPSRYTLGGQPVVVDATSARLIDGTLAGSILTLDQAVRNIVRWAGVGVVDALRMVTEIPARLLAMPDRGRIARGAVADFALFDTALRVVAAIVGGQQVYGGAPPGVGTGQQPNWN